MRNARKENASVFVLSLVVMTILFTVGVGYLHSVKRSAGITADQKGALQATLTAEAGVEAAIHELVEDPSWRTGFTEKPFGGGAYTVTVADNPDGYVEIVSKGSLSSRGREVTVEVEVTQGQGGADPETVALYHLNEAPGSTTALDASGNGHDGTLTDMDPTARRVPGHWNGGIEFAFGEYVLVPDHPALNPAALTVEAWYYPKNLARSQWIASKDPGGAGPGFQLLYESSSQAFRFEVDSGSSAVSALSTTTPSPSTWYHVAGTYDGSRVAIWVNGVKEASEAQSGSFANNDPLKIGEAGTGSSAVVGILDEVRISRVARTFSGPPDGPYSDGSGPGGGPPPPVTIQPDATVGVDAHILSSFPTKNYGVSTALNVGAAKGADATVVLYHMNEGSGNTLKDETGSHDGSISPGGASWVAGKFAAGIAILSDSTPITVPYNPVLWPTRLTVESWVNSTFASPSYVVYAWGATESRGYSLRCFTAKGKKRIEFRIDTDTGSFVVPNDPSKTPLAAGTWYHVAATYDGVSGEARLFIDGVWQGTVNGIAGGYVPSPGAFTLGENGLKTLQLDEIRISSDTLYPQDDSNFPAPTAEFTLGGAGSLYRSLLAFDVSGLTAPSGIESASLQLYLYGADGPTPVDIDLHPLSAAWTEGSKDGTPGVDGVEWETRDGQTPWAQPGGDFGGIQATAVGIKDAPGWHGWDITRLVKQWRTGGIPNQGVLLKARSEAVSATTKLFHSSDHTDPALRPRITITYEDPWRPGITGAEKIRTVAGVPGGPDESTGDGGPARDAHLGTPTAAAVDPFGDLYIAEWTSGRVRKVDMATGTIDLLASGFTRIESLLVDGSGSLLIVDFDQNKVLKMDPATSGDPARLEPTDVLSTFAGTGVNGFGGDGGPANLARLGGPEDVAVDASGNVFIADNLNARIRKVDLATGIIDTVAGNGTLIESGDGGPAISAGIGRPHGVEIDAFGNLLLTAIGVDVVRRVLAGENARIEGSDVIRRLAGSGSTSDNGPGLPASTTNLSAPWGMAVDSLNNLYVVEASNIWKMESGPDSILDPADIMSMVVSTYPPHPDAYAGEEVVASASGHEIPRKPVFGPDGRLYFTDMTVRIGRQVDGEGMGAQGDIDTVALYHLDEAPGSATALDASGNGLDGTLTNMDPASDWVAGYWSGGLELASGSGEHVLVPDDAALNPPQITVEAWYFGKDFTYTQWMVRKRTAGAGPGYELRYESNTGTFEFGVSTGGAVTWARSATIPALNAWYHVAGTYDGSAVKIWVNGVEEAISTQSGSIANALPMWIGGTGGSTDSVAGILDEVRICRVARDYARPPTEEYDSGAGPVVTTVTEISWK